MASAAVAPHQVAKEIASAVAESRPCSALSLARPPSAGGQQLARLRAEAADSIIILPAEKLHLLDVREVKVMEQFALSNRNFLSAFDRAMDFIGPHRAKALKRPKTMKNPPDDCKDVFTLNLGDLGERLFLTSKSICRDFSFTFAEYQKLSQGVYYQRLEALFSIADEPVPIQDFFQILPIIEITKAVNRLTKVSESWPYMADLYMANIYEMQGQNGAVKGEVAQLERAVEELKKGEIRLHELLASRAESQANLEQALDDEAAMQSVRASEGDMKQYYETQLDQVSKKRAYHESRLQECTFRWYGPFKFFYENDVKLAEKNVQKFTDEESKLREKIAQLTEASNKNLMESSAKETRFRAVKAAEELKLFDTETLPRARAAIAKIEAQREKIERRIAYFVKKQGATNVDTFLETMHAMKAVGKGAGKTADGGSVVARGWVKDVNFTGVLLNRMARGTSVADQIKAFKALQAFTSRPDNDLCQVLIHCDPILTVGDSGAATDDPMTSRSTIFIDLPDVDEADLPEIGVVEMEEIPLPQVSDEVVESAADEVTLPIAETYAELVQAEVPEEVASGAACENVIVDDMAAEFAD